jgi:hypothetical protein
LLGTIELSIDGRQLKKVGWLNKSTWVTASDGTTHELRLVGGLFATNVEVGGHKIELESPVPYWQRILILAPWLLIFVGGLVGGLFAGLAMELNRRLARAEVRLPLKALAMVLTTVLAGGLWFGTALAIAWYTAPLPDYQDGACYDGWWSSPADGLELERVDCTAEHDAEVTGGFRLSDGAYPGAEAIFGWADEQCAVEFKEYVGVPPEQSSLLMQYGIPTEELWGRGMRDIDCFVTSLPDGSLAGSVAGSGQ